MRLLGAHLSIAGGVSKSIERGVSLGCAAIQIFTGFSNRWHSKPIPDEQLCAFRQQRDRLKVIFAHNNYLINLASPEPVISSRSYESMLEEMERAQALGLPYLVIHPGSHLGRGEEEGLRAVAQHLNSLFADTRGSCLRILLETTAGQGSNLGYRFEHLAKIISSVHSPERVGICFDTCHVFAAGYDLRTQQGYEKTFLEFDRLIGTSAIFAFHLNDSKYELGSRKDRHEHIGQGLLGMEAFRLLLNDERFAHVPMVIETPKGKGGFSGGLSEDKRNLAVLRSLIITEAFPSLPDESL
ncbi:MAG: deoxyribonuclease IV [bacterium]|nr:deoxyribonuclease IV [bacterium]